MSKPISKKQMNAALKEYLELKEEISELSKREEELKAILFSSDNIDNLPETFETDNSAYIKQERAATVAITIAMLEECNLDLNMIIPTAKFSMTTCKAIYGAAGERKLKASTLLAEEKAATTPSIFYKKA